MEKFNSQPEVEEEVNVKGKIKGYVTPKFVILTAAVAGTGLYLVGRTRGFHAGVHLGYSKGRADGYEEGVKAIGGIVKEIRNTIEGE